MVAAMSPRAHASAGAKSRARICPNAALHGPAALVLMLGLVPGLILGAGACSTPVVAGRAVWIGGDRDADGGRTLFTYSAGSIETSTLRPLAPDPETDELPLLVELDPRGRGALVRGADAGWLHVIGDASGLRAGYLDLEHRRALPLWLPGIDAGEFTGDGNGLWWFDRCPTALAVVPLTAGVALASEDHDGPTTAPLRRAIGAGASKMARADCEADPTLYELASAADAPVVFVIEAEEQFDGRGPKAGGRVEALRVPVRDDVPARLELLAEGALLPLTESPERLPAARCPPGGSQCGVAAVDPDGSAMFVASGGTQCRLLRWEVATGKASCAVARDAPDGLQSADLLAAVSGEDLVYSDGREIHRYRWRTGELDSRPLLAVEAGVALQVTADGRAVVVVSPRGPMLRVATGDIEILSVEQRTCFQPQPPVVSPSGRIAAWTCSGVDLGEEADALAAGEVVRVSEAGMERFQGVPMWALAIDDSGDLLLHSRISADFSPELGLPPESPRNLYVLSGAGALERIDGLEPDPEMMRGLGPGEYHWIAARPF